MIMAGKAILTCRPTSHPFQDRTLTLEHPVKIGRSVARARANAQNAIFDCKVLSRNHAIIWYSNGKFYLQDTRSSNGTFVNNQRLSKSGEESAPREVSSGDIVQFGVDVLESTRKVTHGCIIANLKLYFPDGKEAKSSTSPAAISSNSVPVEDLYELHQYIQEAAQRENLLKTKLLALQGMLNNIKEAANEGWKALICEDRLLTRVEVLENQLQAYSKNFGEEKLKDELKKLQEDKNLYQTTAKGFFKKALEEKLEAVQKCQEVKRSLLNAEAQCSSLNEELEKNREHVQDLAQRLSAQIAQNEDLELKLVELEEQHKEAMTRMEARNRELEEMLSHQHATEACLTKQLEELRAAENRVNEKSITIELQDVKRCVGTEFSEEESVDSVCYDPDKMADQLKYSVDLYQSDQQKNEELIELLKAQLVLLDKEKITHVVQINAIQSDCDHYSRQHREYEAECQALDTRIDSLELQVRQKMLQQLSPDSSSFESQEENDKIVNGLNNSPLETLESQLKELKASRIQLKKTSMGCELRKNCVREELDRVKQNLAKTCESWRKTQANLQKAQKEIDERAVIMDTFVDLKMLDEYSNDEKCPFHDKNLQNQNTINKKSLEEEDLQQLKKSLVEAQQREKQSKNEAAQLRDKIEALVAELESRPAAPDGNKVLEELEESKQDCAKSKNLISRLESELKTLRERLNELEQNKVSSDLIPAVGSPQAVEQVQHEDRSKLADLEEKLITLGTKYMECSEEKAKLAERLKSLQLDYQAISHQKYFNLFFALPCILLLLALTVAFYPTLSYLMGTADKPEGPSHL